ncbi:MAG: adenylate/guanylate cyclase domain-containing protein [Deltaproteobacteria bacterium]|nr:MAG: adenylate/guanylate cyclase domain-containing protein [Deltaproteobacteria bacterium]
MTHPRDPGLWDPDNSDQRLWRLIERRMEPGADTARIDETIWRLFGETWAIAFTDLAGFSRRTERFGIIHFLQTICAMRRLLYPLVEAHRGFLLKQDADSLLLLFRDPGDALRGAIAMQRACAQANERLVAEEQILLCVGIGYGRILRVGSHEAWGAQVNAASKLGEDTAKAGDILVTGAVRDAVGDGAEVGFDDLALAVPGSDRNYRVRYA